ALHLAASLPQSIHLLLTDVMLPGMSGAELAKALASQRPAIKVLYLSGYTENALATGGVLRPEVNYLSKPFNPDGLAAKVREVLDAAPKKSSVLVVDDEDDVREYLKSVLEQEGYDVRAARDGKEALVTYRDAPADLIITDIVMPEQEGIETIQI